MARVLQAQTLTLAATVILAACVDPATAHAAALGVSVTAIIAHTAGTTTGDTTGLKIQTTLVAIALVTQNTPAAIAGAHAAAAAFAFALAL